MIKVTPVLLGLAFALFSSAAPAGAEGGLVAEYAVLLGERDGVPEVTSEQAGTVFSWTAAAGTEHLRQLFGLATLDAFQLGSALLASSGGDFAASGSHPSGEIKIRFRVRPGAGTDEETTITEAATIEVEVWQDRQILAAPTVTARFGELALLSSGLVDDHGLLWVVLRVHRTPAGAEPQG